MKLQEAIMVFGGLAALKSKSMSPRAAFAVARMSKALIPEITLYEESRNELITKYQGVPDTDGNRYVFTKENGLSFQKEIDDLLSEEITAVIKPIQLSMLGNIEVTPDEAASLFPILEDNE